MSDITKQFGLRIRHLRNERHMSQEEVAFKARISPAHLGQIERATKNPTIETVAGIAAALDVPVASLFDETIAVTAKSSSTVDKINAHLQAMTESEQADMLRIIRMFHRCFPKSIKH